MTQIEPTTGTSEASTSPPAGPKPRPCSPSRLSANSTYLRCLAWLIGSTGGRPGSDPDRTAAGFPITRVMPSFGKRR